MMTPSTDLPAGALATVTARLAEPVRLCVLEVGQARGRADAAALAAALSPDALATLCTDVIDRGYNTGELAAALHRIGALKTARLFAANAEGYFHVFCRHTIAVMLTHSERNDLARTGADETVVAAQLHDTCAWALMHGWETAVAAALTALRTRLAPAERMCA